MFEMTGEGMREVPGASEALLSERAHGMSGSAVLCAMEGSRSGIGRRAGPGEHHGVRQSPAQASGVDLGRLALLLAVLEKRAGLTLYNQDVYVNIAGGLQLTEPAADLALCAAVGLLRQERGAEPSQRHHGGGGPGRRGAGRGPGPTPHRRVRRMGFDQIILPAGNLRGLKEQRGVTLYGVKTVPRPWPTYCSRRPAPLQTGGGHEGALAGER